MTFNSQPVDRAKQGVIIIHDIKPELSPLKTNRDGSVVDLKWDTRGLVSSYVRRRRAGGRRDKRGMTITELMLTLAVGAFILGGVVALYGKATSATKETQAVQQVAQIVKSVRQLYANDGAYGSSGGSTLNTSLIQSRSLPDGMVNLGANTIRHSFGGAVTVTGYANTFQVSLAEFPQDGCAKALTSLLGTGDLVSVQVGSGSTRTPPVTADVIIADCGSASSSTLALTYR